MARLDIDSLRTLLIAAAAALSFAAAGTQDWRLPAAGQPLTEQDYDKLLAAERVDFGQSHSQSLGPVAVQVESFDDTAAYFRILAKTGMEPDDEDLHKITLDVRLAHVPNLNLSFNLVTVEAERLWTASGPLEGKRIPEGGQLASWSTPVMETGPPPRLQGSTSLEMPPGLPASDVTRIEGTVRVALPLGVECLNFHPGEVGAQKTVAGLNVRLSEATERAVTFDWDGRIEHLLTAVAYDEQGGLLKKKGHWVTGTRTDSDDEHRNPSSAEEAEFRRALRQKRFLFSFNEPFARICLVMASGFATREYTFDLSR